MARGFKTGGRKTGSKNRRTQELEAATANAAKQISEALGVPFDGDAHALLMAIYKDTAKPIELRLDAAKAAIRFEKPALSSVDSTGEVVHRYVARLPEKVGTTDEWQKQHAPQTIQ
ncbi:hypothetical protein ABIF26_009583 [Bradyrhizobium elkanii]|uniref:hypothetical protein n=1 Tax=Bradyrhizobium elkanii TaxID=29448 RepID=UPI00351393D6